jgi:integrase
VRQHAAFMTVEELLERWLGSDHDWRPSTWSGYRSNARALGADSLARVHVTRLDAAVVRAAIGRWRDAGATVSVISGRFRTLRAALGWAHGLGMIDRNPVGAMRGPPQPPPRLHVQHDDIRRLVRHVEQTVEKAQAELPAVNPDPRQLHRAEQVLLLVRLAADTGARRSELAALQFADLEDRVLHISRGVSMEQIGPTQTGRVRRLTLGATTARLWREFAICWLQRLAPGRELGPWLFSANLDHSRRMTTSHLSHLFVRARSEAGLPAVTLHRLRYSVATFLVDRGEILKAQMRLGHKDASTTLRNYAHALPLQDVEVADALDALLADR